MLAGIISSPSAYSTRKLPRERDRAPQPGAPEHARPGLHHPGGVHRIQRSEPIPTPDADRAAGRELRGPLLHLLAAPAAGRPLRRRRGVRRRPADQVDARPRAPEARSRRSSSRRSPGSRRPPRSSCSTTRRGGVLAMVGGSDYQQAPFNLATNGHRQPGSSFKPFTLVTALEQGRSPDEVFTSAPQEIPFRIKVAKKNGKGDKVVPDLFRVNNYDDNYLGSASIAQRDDLLRQLRLLPARHPGRGPERRRDREQDGDRDRPLLDQGLRVLDRGRAVAAVQPGADPRWARDRRHPARDGARVQHARGTTASGSRARWHRTPAARSGFSTSPTAATASATRAATRCADQDRRQRRQQAESRSRWSTRRSRRPPRTCSLPWSPPEPANAPRPATRPWGKTGTTDDNGDAWFCGATPKITACIWVGYRGHGDADGDRVRRRPGGRRHLPRPDLLPDRRRLRRDSRPPTRSTAARTSRRRRPTTTTAPTGRRDHRRRRAAARVGRSGDADAEHRRAERSRRAGRPRPRRRRRRGPAPTGGGVSAGLVRPPRPATADGRER